ncbi:unnamed protein product [Orchesella dallaii]|uniref:Poly(A)-specific ribonuclease RNA-binding domain-containing protein n=1 Tax=Orchesella dallaii TaxID=48710 RepID=A0ABP1R3T3_9HEXA
MEVTKDNFDDLLPEILEGIERCTFIALDTELTGLHPTDQKENYFDSVEERYKVLRKSASQFLLVQFGLVLFFYDPVTDRFIHRAYNFYIFPKQFTTNAPNVRFLCEASSLEFLASWGFDFNKLIYKGIPYLTLAVEQKMKDTYDKKQLYLAEENSTPLPVPENLRKFMEETQKQVKNLVSGELKELLLDDLNPFQRKLIFNNIKPKFNDLYFETVLREDDMDSSSVSESDTESSPAGVTKTPRASTGRPTRSRILRVAKMTEGERKARDDEKKKQAMVNINKGVGFSKVIRKISESGKICVGHNMILDIAHSIHQFVDDLPEDLATFKALVQTAFPNLVDTKLMCCTHPFRELFSSSVLGDVLKRVQDDPFSLPTIQKEGRENSLSYELSDLKSHEAGYDAFITGVCFIGLCQHLGTLQTPKKKIVLPDSPLVMPFLNKLYLMRMLDITYMNISGTDLTPRRDHVFYVNCPKESTTKTILNLFSPFGQVQVFWQDDNNLFVSLNDKDQAALVMKNIECEGSIKVVPFCQYQKSLKEKKRPLHRDSPDRGGVYKVSETSQEAPTAIISNSSGRQHSSSEGSSSPPLESVQKKKRPKTESRSFKKSNKPGKGNGSTSKKEAAHFDEPSNWD